MTTAFPIGPGSIPGNSEDGYLELLRFYLNHRRFPRSDRPERVGKSPAELLTGQTHPHWLQRLGYTRFQRT